MNTEQLLSLVRQVLLFGGGFVVAKGWIDQETMIALVGMLTAIAGSVWAFSTRTRKSIVSQAAAIVPVPVTSQREVGIQQTVTVK